MTEDMIPMDIGDVLKFRCGPENECFNACCRDLNQSLTPYDILRLKQHLGMTSAEFLKKYTSRHTGPVSGLPVVEFKPDPASGYACPFVAEQGCTVYESRPGSCRMYPLARAVSRSRDSGVITEYYARIEEPHCLGFAQKGDQTVKSWLETQKVAPYNHANDKLMDIISLKNTIMPGKLDGRLADRFYLALYDLDTFRSRIIETDLLAGIEMPSDLMSGIRTDDEKLLDFGLMWLRRELFGKEMNFG